MAATDSTMVIGSAHIRLHDEGNSNYTWDAGLAAARRGDDFFAYQIDSDNAWTTDYDGGYTAINDTDSTSYKALGTGDIAIITQAYLQLETLSDEIKLQYGYFEGARPGASSDFTALGIHLEAFTGAANSSANNMQVVDFWPPLKVAQSATAGCLGFRAQINDTNVEASFGMRGWIEKSMA